MWHIQTDRSGGYFNETPSKATVYKGNAAQPSGFASASTSDVSIGGYGTPVGGLYTFSRSAVSSRVGISWISTAKACQNVQSEIPANTAFSSVVQETKDIWNSEILSKITTTATDTTSLGLLYTSLYFMNLLPTNQTGENPGWTSNEPCYSDLFTLWDLFRCSTSLFQILQPVAYEEYIRSLIDIYRYDGYMPDARSSNYNGRSQGGSNADNILADAYVKGVRGQVDWTDGYAAMVKDAEVQPPNTIPPDPMAPDSSTAQGRGALPDWLKFGFITHKYTRAASRAVEYAYNDFSLFQVATGLSEADDATKYLSRSRNWRNHWDQSASVLGYTGFVVPRNEAGFLPTELLNAGGYWGDAFYEASAWDYSFADVHDMAHIIELMGGNETFYKRLETTFQVGGNPGNPRGTIFDPTNEP